MAEAAISPFVSPSWLDHHRDDVVVADTRWYLDGRSGLEAFSQGHLPGAVFVDLDRWLSGPPMGGARHPLPAPEVFADGMSRLGIGDHSVVVAYDDAGGVIAARLVWMLRVLGHRAAVLDGGLLAYTGTVETTAVEPVSASFTAKPWPAERLADIDTVRDGDLMIDARNRDRYRGEYEPVDPRPGHVPGAVNIPCRENLSADGRLISTAALQRKYTETGAFDAKEIIAYCGSGVTACHTLLTLELVGVTHGRLYPGSWSEYSSAPDRPVALGPS